MIHIYFLEFVAAKFLFSLKILFGERIKGWSWDEASYFVKQVWSDKNEFLKNGRTRVESDTSCFHCGKPIENFRSQTNVLMYKQITWPDYVLCLHLITCTTIIFYGQAAILNILYRQIFLEKLKMNMHSTLKTDTDTHTILVFVPSKHFVWLFLGNEEIHRNKQKRKA